MYFPKHRVVIEADEKGHEDKKKCDEDKREHLYCKFKRINPDGKDYQEYVEFIKIINYIDESNEKLTKESSKKSVLENLSKRLSELELKSHHSIKSKCLKYVPRKILPS